MSYEDDWFQYTNEFNRPAGSPGADGNYYEPGNIDNIPLNDDVPSPGQGLDFDLNVPIDDYQYDLRLSPSQNGQNQQQQPGTSGSNDGGGQFQNMHIMQNTDSFDQHMQPSTSIEYNSFEMPTVISSNHEVGPYQDLGIDDPNSYYANQEPSTSQGNDMIMNDSYMMNQQGSYMPQMDQMNPSSVGNPSSHSGMNQQIHQDMGGGGQMQQQQQQQKPKPKKSRPNNKKKTTGVSGGETVGTVLTKANKITQQIGNNNEVPGQKVEARVSAEDSIRIGQLMGELTRLQAENGNGVDHTETIARMQSEIAQVFQNSMMVTPSTDNSSQNSILTQIQSLTQPGPSTSSGSMSGSQQPKRPPPKRVRNPPNNNKNTVQQQQQQMQPQIPQAQMTPAKIVMEPPTATLVPSNNREMNNFAPGEESYILYSTMEQQSSGQQQYVEYQQPLSHESMQHQGHPQQNQQPVQTKIVPSMNQRTHTYRQAVIFNSTPSSSNGPGPSPHLQQPQSHESHMDQMNDKHQQYHQQDQQMYVPMQQQQDDRSQQMYQPQDGEPKTLGDVVRQTQGRYQGPQDAPNLRQQLLTNVSATTKHQQQMLQTSQAPTPSPMQHYGEPLHGSYPQSHDNMQQTHSHQSNEGQYENGMGDYYDMPVHHHDSQMVMMQPGSQQQQHYEQEMYQPMEDEHQHMMEPEIEFPQVTVELSEEELEFKMEEKRQARERRLKEVMLDQLEQLGTPVDTTPFNGKFDAFQRMLPYHHFANGEEPVSNFESIFHKTMADRVASANDLGNRIRQVVLLDTMRSKTEWEENMLLYLETESERRKLEEDRKLAEQDPLMFLQSSDIIQDLKNNKLNLEKTRRAVPRAPAHLNELDLQNGQLSTLYKDYEFDSYDENRPRGSPIPFVYEEPESESEPEPEPEPEEEEKKDELVSNRSDLSPMSGFPNLSPVPSPVRSRNESESSCEWKDDYESPLLSPETEKIRKADEELRKDLFGTQEDLDKTEPYPFEQIHEVVQKHQIEQLQSSRRPVEPIPSISSSANSSLIEKKVPEKPTIKSPVLSPISRTSRVGQATTLPPRSPSPISSKPTTSKPIPPPVPARARPPIRDDASPEIDDDYFNSPPVKPIPAEKVAPIPLPVPIHMIKKEKEDVKPRLKLIVPMSVVQKGIEMAASGDDDDDLQEIAVVPRQPLKLKINLKNVKVEESSPEPQQIVPKAGTSSKKTDSVPMKGKEKDTTFEMTPAKTPMKRENAPIVSPSSSSSGFKTPLQTPLKASSDIRKRRSQKIESASPVKRRLEGAPTTSSFVTPKNGLVSGEETEEGERFLKTMTDGRKIILKIGKIPSNINHFVTPRRDKHGNLHKDLSPTKDTRLTMKLIRKQGKLSVEFIEKYPESVKEEEKDITASSSAPKIVSSAPSTSSSMAKSRPAPASRKVSTDSAGKDRKPHLTKNKTAYCNRFNPFANVPTSSKPSASQMTPAKPAVTPKAVPIKAPLPAGFIPMSLSSSTRPESTVTVAPMNLIRTTPIVPQITVSSIPTVTSSLVTPKSEKPTEGTKIAPLLPWMSDPDDSPEQKQKPKTKKSPTVDSWSSKDLLKVKTETSEVANTSASQESPRASSSLSISFFEDDKSSGFPFLRSPKRTKEPLPVVEYSDDEENELAHSTFSHAADHLITNSNLSNSVNGAPPILPWTTDP